MTVLPAPQAGPYTVEEYLELERSSAERHEFLDGWIYAMPGGSREHSAIISNLNASFNFLLRESPCRNFTSDLKVATGTTELYTYPDLSVVCEEYDAINEPTDILTNPVLLAEVFSPSTEAYDRGLKFSRYRRIESLTDYLLVSQNEPMIEYYHKEADGSWELTIVSGIDAQLPVENLGITLLLSEIYRKIKFPKP